MWNVVAGLLLLVHGFVHLRVWVLGGTGGASADPLRSWIAGVPRRASFTLAILATALFAVAGAGALAGQGWAPGAALAAAAVSIALIALVFNRWLTFGLALDAAVVAVAVRALTS